MKKIIQHPLYGEITYEESLWSGKKALAVNGTPLQKVGKDTYTLSFGEMNTLVVLKGNALNGACLRIGGEEVWVVPKAAPLDWVLSVLPFMLMLLWGNNPRLCSIVPVVGGAIGGALGGAGMVITMLLVRDKKGLGKVLTGLLIALATLAIGAVLGFAIVLAMMG